MFRYPYFGFLAVLMAACSSSSEEPGSVGIHAIDARVRSYPCDERPEETPPAVPLALTGRPHFQNEVHDCQRLVISDDNGVPQSFGPLVGIFPLLNRIDDDSDFDDPVVIATIYNWGGGTDEEYPGLGIGRGWHCLWMHRQGSGFGAGIATIDPATNGCMSPQDSSEVSFTPLRVLAQKHVDPTEPYPATARWSWEQTRGHYIEIRCGSSWCAIGQDGFIPRYGTTFAQLPESAVPGWGDEQHLALPSPAGLRPGPWGRIAPSAEYVQARRDGPDAVEDAFRDGIRAADITVDQSTDLQATYRDKFRLASATGTGHIRIELRKRFFFFNYRRAWFEAATEESSARANLDYMKGVNHAATGATRWRWLETDEVAWVSCPRNSCCSVEP